MILTTIILASLYGPGCLPGSELGLNRQCMIDYASEKPDAAYIYIREKFHANEALLDQFADYIDDAETGKFSDIDTSDIQQRKWLSSVYLEFLCCSTDWGKRPECDKY